VAWVGSELYRQSDRHLPAKLVPIILDRGFHVVSVTNPYGRILDFLDRSRYFFFQVVISNPTQGMDVCVLILCLCCHVSR
jgi:hypothetical protein